MFSMAADQDDEEVSVLNSRHYNQTQTGIHPEIDQTVQMLIPAVHVRGNSSAQAPKTMAAAYLDQSSMSTYRSEAIPGEPDQVKVKSTFKELSSPTKK